MNNKKVFDFIGYRKILFLIPIAIAVITVIFNCIFGVEMAIEFKGGTMLTYSYTGEIDTNAVKKTVEGENYGAVTVTTGSSMNSSLEVVEISFSSSEGLTADKQTALSDKLQQTFKDNSLTLVNSQDVNPTSGAEFFLKCLVAVLFSFVLLVIYIAFRFKKIGGLSAGVFALVALVHDCFMVYAVFVFCRFPIDANFMAVVLTVLGNSINNTIVVYDRIRENRNLYGNSLSLRSERIKNFLERMKVSDDDAVIQSKMISRQVESAQKRVEGNNYDTRKQVLQFDDVMRAQREVIYAQRQQVIMEEKSLKPIIMLMIERTV